jgi:hypothetical protein
MSQAAQKKSDSKNFNGSKGLAGSPQRAKQGVTLQLLDVAFSIVGDRYIESYLCRNPLV